jgi:4a-hydroxytetrahydrobiopterin dehydratase
VSAGEQETLLKDIDGWAINTDPCDMLVKKYNFESYDEAVSFTNAIAEMAEAEGHHPKIILEWGQVFVSWWSHKINGLHKNDFICAAKTDQLFQS